MWVHTFFCDPAADEIRESPTVSALVEIRPNHAPGEISGLLRDAGTETHELPGNLISVRGSVNDLKHVGEIADVHINPYQKLSDKYL
jgi:hypothetical protein